MKKTEENRYPHAATLFRFCKEALEIRYEGNVKVIDQDVGAILGYDPADCSHWKKGKKNIRALSTIKTIADHLSVDERLLIEITAGKVGLNEAVFEFKGYGMFGLNGKYLENLKKEYFKNPSKWQTTESRSSFEEIFELNRPAIEKAARYVIEKGNFTEAPIYLPEIEALFPQFKLVQDTQLTQSTVIDSSGETKTLTFKYLEMRPYVRFLALKELFKLQIQNGEEFVAAFAQSPAEILDIQANLFASMVLIPGSMLKKEVERVDHAYDIISQLAEIFWVSKSLMNQRLRDYMEYLN